jgi:hypothetical protein
MAFSSTSRGQDDRRITVSANRSTIAFGKNCSIRHGSTIARRPQRSTYPRHNLGLHVISDQLLNEPEPRRFYTGRQREVVDFACGCVATLDDGDPDTLWFQDVTLCRMALEHQTLR